MIILQLFETHYLLGRLDINIDQNQHVCIQFMSEIQNNQQAQEFKLENASDSNINNTQGDPKDVEDTTNLQISQFANSSIYNSVSENNGSQSISVEDGQRGQTSETSEKLEIVGDETGQVNKVEQVKRQENEPSSPKTTREELPVQLSPRLSSRRSTSPQISRTKIDTTNKMIQREEQKTQILQTTLTELTNKKIELQKALNQKIITQKSLKERQEEEEKLTQAKTALEQQVNTNEAELRNLNEKKKQQAEAHKKELQRIQQENKRLEAEAEAQRVLDENKRQEHEASIYQAKSTLQKQQERLSQIQKQHHEKLNKKEEIALKIVELTNAKNAAQQKLTNSQKQKQEQSKAQETANSTLLQRIAEIKEKINNKKNELTQVKSQNNDGLKNQQEKIKKQIEAVHAVNSQLTESNKKLEQQLQNKNKDNTESKQAEKRKEKRIIDLTKKSEQLTKKANDFKQEIAKLDSQKQEKKIIRYQEKVPEEYLAIQAKNNTLKKEIKDINARYIAEKAEMQKLVPPSVIQNINKKISTAITNNQKLTEITKIIETVSKENEQLALEMDRLEWGENNHLKNLDTQRKKQQQRNKDLEEELQSKKKQLQQLNNKLDQYIKHYPDYKIKEKKPIKKEKGGNKQ